MRKRIQGFTLVELMIVVTIVGLLALMAIPAFSRARTKTQHEMCQYNQRLIFEQMNVYCLDTGTPLTTASFPHLCACRDALVPLAVGSVKYIKTRKVFACPANGDQTVQHDYAYIVAGTQITGLRCTIRPSHNTTN